MSNKLLKTLVATIAAAMVFGLLTGCSNSSTGAASSGGSSAGTAAKPVLSDGGSGAAKPGTYVSPVDSKGILQPLPPTPMSQVPPKNVTSPVGKGKSLTSVAKPPHKTTRAAFALGSIPSGSAYTVKVQPYGYGPSTYYGSRVILKVVSAQPIGKAPKASSRFFSGDLLVLMDPNNGGNLVKGGTYTAKLTFYSDGETIVMVLSDAKLN